jgi:two-component system sensor histidine kinase UhpB
VAADFAGAEGRFRPEVEVNLFRIAQGAIGNILEHSEAKNAHIKLECNASECLLCIEDDGKGFDVSKLRRVDPSGRGAGLFTMKERVRLAGGSCRVESRPGRGARVVVKVPLESEEKDEEDQSADSR